MYATYEECECDEAGVEIYDDYIRECFRNAVSPNGAATIGKIVGQCFPNAKAVQKRDTCDKTKSSRKYLGLKKIYHNEDIGYFSNVDIIKRGLPNKDFTVEEEEDKGFLIKYMSHIVCCDHEIIYNIHISSDLIVSMVVLDTNIPLGEHGIWSKLSVLSSDNIFALLKSILTLQLCVGVVYNGTPISRYSVLKEWKSPDQPLTSIKQHSINCKVLVGMTVKTQKCVKCYKASRPNKNINKPSAIESPNHQGEISNNVTTTAINVNQSTTHKSKIDSNPSDDVNNSFQSAVYGTSDVVPNIPATDCDNSKHNNETVSTPTHSRLSLSHATTPSPINVNSFYKKTQTCDASVGTTPIKSAKQVLLKFFPYLMEKPALLGLLSDQVETAKHKDARGRRYEKEVISLALTLWTRSPKNYDELRKSGLLLPSPKTLSLYKNCVEQTPGINPNMMRWMANEARSQNLNAIGYVGGLILDEMNVQKSLDISNKRGEWKMVGFPDLGEGSSAMASLSKNKNTLKLADHMLQFLFHGLTGFRMPFASFPTNQANSCDLYLNVWDSVSALQDWGFTVAYLCLDGSSNNRSFIKMHFDSDPLSSNMQITNRTNPSKKIFVIPDPSHVIKKVRNNIYSSGTGLQHTRHLSIDDHFIEWNQWEQAFEWCQDRLVNPIAPHPNLTREHIYLSEPAKMRNAFANEALNDNMLYLMESFQKSLDPDKGESLNSALKLLQHTSTVIRNMNDKRPIEDINDQRLLENKSTLSWLTQWENSAETPKQLMSSECREDFKWMLAGFDGLAKELIQNYKTCVYACDINSDVIENFFCSQRGIMGGNTTNPSVRNYMHNINSIIIGQSTISSKSNAGCKGKSAAPYKYTTPVALRPKESRKRKLFTHFTTSLSEETNADD